ncbi:hypothetical protein ACJX0J_009762, partial [Zea mays]
MGRERLPLLARLRRLPLRNCPSFELTSLADSTLRKIHCLHYIFELAYRSALINCHIEHWKLHLFELEEELKTNPLTKYVLYQLHNESHKQGKIS